MGSQVHGDVRGVRRVVQHVEAGPAVDEAGNPGLVAELERVQAGPAHQVLNGRKGDAADRARVGARDVPHVGHFAAGQGVDAGSAVDGHRGAGRVQDGEMVAALAAEDVHRLQTAGEIDRDADRPQSGEVDDVGADAPVQKDVLEDRVGAVIDDQGGRVVRVVEENRTTDVGETPSHGWGQAADGDRVLPGFGVDVHGVVRAVALNVQVVGTAARGEVEI